MGGILPARGGDGKPSAPAAARAGRRHPIDIRDDLLKRSKHLIEGSVLEHEHYDVSGTGRMHPQVSASPALWWPGAWPFSSGAASGSAETAGASVAPAMLPAVDDEGVPVHAALRSEGRPDEGGPALNQRAATAAT
jgi:hypothetical protein